MARVQRDAAPRAAFRVAVEITSVDDQVVWEQRDGGLGRTQLDQVVEKDTRRRVNLDADEAIVMRAPRGADHASRSRCELWHGVGVRGIDARSWRRKLAIGSAAPNDDPVVARLVGEREGACERGSRLERDHVTRTGSIQGRLEVPARLHGNDPARRWHVGRIDVPARALGLARTCRQRDGGAQRNGDEGGDENPQTRPHEWLDHDASLPRHLGPSAASAERA